MVVKGKRGQKIKGGAKNRLRIIGGIWRGRRIDFPDSAGLRPTSDRVRETLFNWLQWTLPGSRCLDLFAGSGVLAFEAVSRGASEAVLVEAMPSVARFLRDNATRLASDKIHIVNERAEIYLQGASRAFDIVFLDPPFGEGRLAPALNQLAQGDWLRPGAYVYIEYESEKDTLDLPTGFSLSRQLRAGRATGLLARWGMGEATVADR